MSKSLLETYPHLANDFVYKLGELGRTPGYDVPGYSIMNRVAGSRAFNCDIETSDWDWAGVYIAPLSRLLGLNPPKESWKLDAPNCQYHEVRRFAEMLAEGTPAALESAFCERMIHVTPPWEALRLIRDKFVTQQAVVKYIRYGEGQLKKYLAGQPVHAKGGKPGEKWLYHVVRLAKQAVHIAGGGMPYNWQEGGDRELLLSIRRQEVPESDAVTIARELFKKARGMEPYPLPEGPDIGALENWIIDTREQKWLHDLRGIKQCLSLKSDLPVLRSALTAGTSTTPK